MILKGCEMLGMDLNDIILETIAGMRKVAAEIGLQGNLNPRSDGKPRLCPARAGILLYF